MLLKARGSVDDKRQLELNMKMQSANVISHMNWRASCRCATINKCQTRFELNEEITINKEIAARRASAVTQSLINRFVIGNRSETARRG